MISVELERTKLKYFHPNNKVAKYIARSFVIGSSSKI